jgi:hypothetical protein
VPLAPDNGLSVYTPLQSIYIKELSGLWVLVESWACPYKWHWICRTQCLHGQFDVGVSRGTNWGRVQVLLKEGREAMNIVYTDVLLIPNSFYRCILFSNALN